MTIINNDFQMASVKSDCQCQTYNEETGEYEPTVDYCYGDCFEWQEEDAFWLIDEWRKAKGIEENDPIKVECQSMTWQNVYGYRWTTAKEMYKSLYLDGDFTIEWFLTNDGTLTARRYSHDEPTGTAPFTFEHYIGCDKCGEPVLADIHKEEMGFCVECQHAYFDHSDEE